MGSIEDKRLWNRWLWERPWIGFPSLKARRVGWVAPSHPYPAGFIPIWDYFAWNDFARLASSSIQFSAPSKQGLEVMHLGVLAREVATSEHLLLIFKTEEEKYPFPPEWELVVVEVVTRRQRRLGYFSKFPQSWVL